MAEVRGVSFETGNTFPLEMTLFFKEGEPVKINMCEADALITISQAKKAANSTTTEVYALGMEMATGLLIHFAAELGGRIEKFYEETTPGIKVEYCEEGFAMVAEPEGDGSGPVSPEEAMRMLEEQWPNVMMATAGVGQWRAMANGYTGVGKTKLEAMAELRMWLRM